MNYDCAICTSVTKANREWARNAISTRYYVRKFVLVPPVSWWQFVKDILNCLESKTVNMQAQPMKPSKAPAQGSGTALL